MRKIAAGIAMLALLGGCQTIFGRQARLDIQPVGAADASGLIALEEGRQALRAGDPGSAIISLQIAAADPATLADAHNAMGVAYAMLGRGDLAERYFQQAVAENPSEEKFAANLARFYRSREAALARTQAPIVLPMPAVEVAAAEPTLAVAPPADRIISAGPGTVRVSLPSGGAAITRVSRHEVSIRTKPASSPVPAADGRRRNPSFASASPAAPLGGVPRATTPPGYPIRIDLASVGATR